MLLTGRLGTITDETFETVEFLILYNILSTLRFILKVSPK